MQCVSARVCKTELFIELCNFNNFECSKYVAKNTANTENLVTNETQINKWWHQQQEKNRIKFYKQTHILNNVCEREQKKTYNRKTSKHRRISVDICHFFFFCFSASPSSSSSSSSFWPFCLYEKKTRYKRIKEMVYVYIVSHTQSNQVQQQKTQLE